ncbi:MAG: recombination protein NinG [bacterium]
MRTRRCALCRAKTPETDAIYSKLKSFCSMEHLVEYSKSNAAKQLVKKAKAKETRERKEKLRTRSDWLKLAQKAFNEYIRVRDAGKPCISCGASQGDTVLGGAFDAGHYRSTGSAPHLRFHVNNCHAQCVKCNRYLGGNIVEYRKRLIDRCSLEIVEALEQDDRPRNYKIHDLKRIIESCKKRTKQKKKWRQKTANAEALQKK